MNNKFISWIPSLLLMLVIYQASGDSDSGGKSELLARLIWKYVEQFNNYRAEETDIALTIVAIRKFAHMTEYFLLTISYYYALGKSLKQKTDFKYRYMPAAIMAVLYACSDELHQSFIPNRVGTYKDVLIDSAGICFAFLVLSIYKRKK